MNLYKGSLLQSVIRVVWFGLIALFAVGCGSGKSPSQGEKHAVASKTMRATALLTKGNYTDVASWCYRKVTDAEHAAEIMPVTLPGNGTEDVSMHAYHLDSFYKSGRLAKITLSNYQERLEMKFVGDDVNIHFFGPDFTLDRKMPLDRFKTMSEG